MTANPMSIEQPADPSAPRERVVTVDNGAEVFVRSIGSGPPLYLLHGWGVSSRMWDRQLSAFAEHYEVIAPDIPGFGRSPVPEGRTPGWDGQDSLMRALGHERADVVGLSMGGSIAVEFAATYPQRLGSLVVVPGSIDGWEAPAWMDERFPAVDAAADSGDIPRAVELLMDVPPMRSAKRKPAVHRELVQMFSAHRWDDSWEGKEPPRLDPPVYRRLRDITAPTLIVTGELEDPSFVELAHEMAREIPNAELVTIRDAGHMVNMEAPDEFNAVVLEFLARTSEGSP